MPLLLLLLLSSAESNNEETEEAVKEYSSAFINVSWVEPDHQVKAGDQKVYFLPTGVGFTHGDKRDRTLFSGRGSHSAGTGQAAW